MCPTQSPLREGPPATSVPADHGHGKTLQRFNTLAPGKSGSYFKSVIFKLIMQNSYLSCDISLRSMPESLTNGKLSLVQVMAWCRQAPSHYLSQYRPISTPPYATTRSQLINSQSTKNISRNPTGYIKYRISEKVFQVIYTLGNSEFDTFTTVSMDILAPLLISRQNDARCRVPHIWRTCAWRVN